MGPCAKVTTLRGGPRWKKVFKWCLNILAAQRKIKQNLATCTSLNLHLWPHHSISPPNQKKTHKSAGRPMPSAISTSSDFSNYKIAPRKEIQFRISTENSNNCLSTSPKLQNTIIQPPSRPWKIKITTRALSSRTVNIVSFGFKEAT